MAMSAASSSRSLATCLALLAALAAATPAHAAVVVGTFDPAFGPGVPNLGYRGQAAFFVPDACFANAGIVFNAPDPCSLGAMSVLSASVELYNISTPGEPTLQTLNFSAAAYTVNSVLMVFDGGTAQNEVRGVETNLGSGVATNLVDPGPNLLSGADNINFSGLFWLGFSANARTATLYTCDPAEPLGGEPFCRPDSAGTPAPMRFSRQQAAAVPEPGSAALVLAALAIAGLGRRSRRGT